MITDHNFEIHSTLHLLSLARFPMGTKRQFNKTCEKVSAMQEDRTALLHSSRFPQPCWARVSISIRLPRIQAFAADTKSGLSVGRLMDLDRRVVRSQTKAFWKQTFNDPHSTEKQPEKRQPLGENLWLRSTEKRQLLALRWVRYVCPVFFLAPNFHCPICCDGQEVSLFALTEKGLRETRKDGLATVDNQCIKEDTIRTQKVIKHSKISCKVTHNDYYWNMFVANGF